MPSPFPGMDPYIEGQEGDDFHTRLLTQLADLLTPRLLPRYVARLERRVYLEHAPEGPPRGARPDLVVIADRTRHGTREAGAAAAVIKAPLTVTLPLPEEAQEVYLEIRRPETGQLITVVELLSPSNKRRGSDGHRAYLEKREAVLRSAVHLVEIDLLRGGERLPVLEELPAADYFAIVSRADRRPYAGLWPVRLRERLPEIPIPLAGEDPDAPLDLQAALDAVYDRAGYAYSLRYDREPEPSLNDEDAAWAAELVSRAAARG
jgi:hypothetical protein